MNEKRKKILNMIFEAALQVAVALALAVAMTFALLSFMQTFDENMQKAARASSQTTISPLASASTTTAAHQIGIQIVRDEDGAKAELTCSATAIGRRTLLTATHCFMVPAGVRVVGLTVDGLSVKVAKHLNDGQDHSILLLDPATPPYAKYSPLSTRSLKAGATVSWIGWPAGFGKMNRRGYVAGREIRAGFKGWLVDAMAGPGDSGAGVYDEHGRLVGVISYINQAQEVDGVYGARFVGVLDFDFTREQLEVVK